MSGSASSAAKSIHEIPLSGSGTGTPAEAQGQGSDVQTQERAADIVSVDDDGDEVDEVTPRPCLVLKNFQDSSSH